MPPLIALAESLPTVDLDLLWRRGNGPAGCARDAQANGLVPASGLGRGALPPGGGRGS
jgi:hypothetical protein